MPTKATLLDRAIGYFSPAAGAERIANRTRLDDIQAAGYGFTYGGGAYEGGNSRSRTRKQYAWSRSRIGDEESGYTQYDRDTQVLECRDLYRNNEIVNSVVNMIANYSVWRGIRAIAKTEDKSWNYAAEVYFNEQYFHVADYRNREDVSLADMQRWITIASFTDGGLGFVLLANGQLQPVEYERLRTPQSKTKDPLVRSGIHFNKNGHVNGYYICRRHANGSVDMTKYDYVPRENFIHTHTPFFRADQYVGIPRMAAVLEKLRDYDETDKYQLLKVKHDSMLLLKEKRSGGFSGGAKGGLPFSQQTTTEEGKRTERHDWGMIWRGGEDDDLASFESRNPQPTWTPYLEHHLRVIAPAFGVPYAYLMMEFTQGSYTAQRSASLHARHTFLNEHERICRQFMDRLYNWRIAKAVKQKRLTDPPVDKNTGVSEWYWKKFTKPNYGWLNPGEEAKGKKELWNMGLESLETMIDGEEDRDEVFRSKVGDIQIAQKMAAEFNTENPDAEQLTWRDVISSLAPGQNTPRIVGENKGQDSENED